MYKHYEDSMTFLQDFIKYHPDNWEELLSLPPYCLKIIHKGKYVLFKYNQLTSDFNELIVHEARGLILKEPSMRIVRAAFKKFFNVGEQYAANIDWVSAAATLKLDGSLISLWWDDDEWHFSTNGQISAADAPLECAQFKTYQDLIDEAIRMYPIEWDKLNKDYCYTFELCSPFNRIVIPYSQIQLFHTLTVDLTTLKEIECDIGIPKPAQYYCDGLADYEELVEAFGEEKEGIVVKDKYGQRVKIKSPEYFRLHKMKRNGNLTTAAALKLIITGEDKEFLSYFSEFKPFFSEVRAQYNKKLEKVIEVQQETYKWKEQYPYASKKEFAEWAKKQEYSHYCFLAYQNRLWEELTEAKADVKALMRFLKWEDGK